MAILLIMSDLKGLGTASNVITGRATFAGGAKVSFSHFNAGTTDFSKPKPLLEINHELFAHALFDIYLGCGAVRTLQPIKHPTSRCRWICACLDSGLGVVMVARVVMRL